MYLSYRNQRALSIILQNVEELDKN